jgi:ATP-dependent DNA ligase
MTHLLPELRSCLPDSVQLDGELELESPQVRLVATFEGRRGAVRRGSERGLEGVVAKRERDPYQPGERQLVKTKNRAPARFAEERDRGRRRASATR